jgi:phosphoenolpyruvate carboxylase
LATRERAAHGTKRWSQHVTEVSDALDLRTGVFELDDPREIARSLKRSAEQSHRRKSEPYRSAMSMLTFYINRAGKNLPKKRREILEKAKDELRELYAGSSRAWRRPASCLEVGFVLSDRSC